MPARSCDGTRPYTATRASSGSNWTCVRGGGSRASCILSRKYHACSSVQRVSEFKIEYRGRDSNPYGLLGPRILSPPRLSSFATPASGWSIRNGQLGFGGLWHVHEADQHEQGDQDVQEQHREDAVVAEAG
jgi:hypothetical protein